MCEFLELCLYGSVSARLQGGQALSLDETHKALLGALALTPDGRRAATWLQDALWTGLPSQQAAANLQAALASLRARLGPCGDILSIDGRQVRLDPTRLRLRGGPQDGALLGGAVLPGAQGLRDWPTSANTDYGLATRCK